jgi:hypothetical protein
MAGGFFKKRDAVLAIAVGTLIAVALNVWYNVVWYNLGVRPKMLDGYMWLARIHEPAGSVAERLAHTLYARIGYPWCVRWALVCGYLLLVTMWVLAVFVVIKIGRLMVSVWHQLAQRRRPAV